MKIFKYALSVTDEQKVLMQRDAQVLTVQLNSGQPCLWSVVDEMSDHFEERTVYIIGTGRPIPEGILGWAVYTGTVQIAVNGSMLVWHVFVTPSLKSLKTPLENIIGLGVEAIPSFLRIGQ